MAIVTTQLYGRLCNQLFQYANCIAYSHRYGIPYCIPKNTLNNNVWKPYHFKNVNYCDNSEGVSTATVWTEPSHSYTEIPLFSGRKIVMNGYFQSLKYFEDYLPEVRKAFGFDYEPQSKNGCSIHVRRSDYLNYPDKHPVVNEYYLIEAIKIMAANGYSTFKFHSDDIDWCKNFIMKSPQIARIKTKDAMFFIFSEGKNELEDFQSMLNCSSFIIANSTFSLMAAILSESPNKICISPSAYNWFGSGNSNLNTSTIIPDSFIQIKY